MWINAFEVPVDMYTLWMKQRKNRRKARYRRKLERFKRRFTMKDECCDENGVITKQFKECEECSEFPCDKLRSALNAVINGEN